MDDLTNKNNDTDQNDTDQNDTDQNDTDQNDTGNYVGSYDMILMKDGEVEG